MSNKVSSTGRSSKSKDVEAGEGSYCSVKYWSLEFVAEIRPPKKDRWLPGYRGLWMPCLNAFGFYSVVGSLRII